MDDLCQGFMLDLLGKNTQQCQFIGLNYSWQTTVELKFGHIMYLGMSYLYLLRKNSPEQQRSKPYDIPLNPDWFMTGSL